MIRMRARIAEDEEPASALSKLATTLREHVLDDGERAHVEPRLAHLLGLRSTEPRKQDLFAAWRLFFERLAEAYPTVLLFEDVQWADGSLLDFVEYLLEWSRCQPALCRHSRTPRAGRAPVDLGRRAPELHVPLPGAALGRGDGRSSSTAWFPGCPPELQQRILDRAEGVPLYAVETVRMLLDRGLLAQEGARTG